MSLVAHWRFEGDTTDSVGNNDGNGSPTYVDGKIGQGIDSTGERITVENSGGIKSALNGNHFTLSMWWRQYDNSNYRWSDSIEVDEDRLERGRGDDGNTDADFWCNLGSGDGSRLYNSAVSGVDGTEWFHIVVRRNGDDYEVWVNGEIADSGTRTGEMNYSGNLEIDHQTNGTEMDDIRLYDHAISEKKIEQLSRGKVLHYKLDQDNGMVSDASAQANQGTVNGASYTGDSKVGSGAYEFDGAGDFIGSSLYYDTTNVDGLTVSAWYNSSSNSDHIIASSDRNEYWRLGVGSDGVDGVQWTVNSSDMVSTASKSSVQDGNWHHILAVFDPSLTNDHKIYIDGKLDSEESHFNSGIGNGAVSYTHIGVGSEASSQSGSTGPDDWMDGKLDDVRIYHTALSTDEVQEVYEQRASIDSSGNFHGHELNEMVENGLRLEAYSRGNNS